MFPLIPDLLAYLLHHGRDTWGDPRPLLVTQLSGIMSEQASGSGELAPLNSFLLPSLSGDPFHLFVRDLLCSLYDGGTACREFAMGIQILLQEQQPPEGSHVLSAKGLKPSEEARGPTQTWHTAGRGSLNPWVRSALRQFWGM